MTRQSFCLVLLFSICLSIPVTATAQINVSDISPLVADTGPGNGDWVDATANPFLALSPPPDEDWPLDILINPIIDIPDPNLRAVIEEKLGKAPGADIAIKDMQTLTELHASDANISNLTGLEYATNLKWLQLEGNNISDISALTLLTDLTGLWLDNNSISDISPLAQLIHLIHLDLGKNSISDISPLVENTGLGNEDLVALTGNPLNALSINTHITVLLSRGVEVLFDNVTARLEDIAPIVDILDPNLRTLIEEKLGKSPGTAINVAEMEALTELRASDEDITDLTGLEAATNLTWLHLGKNNISDISALAGLTQLTWLWLHNNSISDISALAGLTQLAGMWLYRNSISDLSPLVENTGLGSRDQVDVTQNYLNTLSINTHIPTLQSRGVIVKFDNIAVPPEDFAQIVDIPDPNLRAAIEHRLDKAPGVTITTADMHDLIHLFGRGANISDLTGLEQATNLSRLFLEFNTISDISPLAELTNLTELGLRDNSISDISPLAKLTSLTELGLQGNSISDISPLAELTQLTYLDLTNNSISDISAVAGLTNLEQLGLSSNFISDISSLAGLTNLEQLGLSSNFISDISSLAGLTELIFLWLNHNSISDISAVAGLTSLIELKIRYNSISDISPIVANTGLGTEDVIPWDVYVIDVRGNLLDDESFNTHILTLQSRGIIVYYDTIRVQPEDLAQTVDIPDPTLRAKIRFERGKPSNADITMADMKTLTKLRAPFSEISDLTGIELATNLTSLKLSVNLISDLSPLVANTGLGDGDYIYVTENPLNEASINTHIPTLQSRGVTVRFDNIIVRPEELTQIVDIPDPNLHARIVFNRHKASDATITMADMKILTEFWGPHSDIRDLTGLELAINLTSLKLDNNLISDLSPLVANIGLGPGDSINVTRNPLNNESINTHIPTLQSRGVKVKFDNVVTEYAEISDPNLRDAIADARGKARDATITVVDMLLLIQLNAPNADISDLTGLQHATNLRLLNLGTEFVEEQRINTNSISDISPLAALTDLTSLRLDNNSISDLSPLVENTGLGNGDKVDVRENFLNAQSINTHIPALQSRGVTVDFDSIIVRPEDIAQTVDIPDPNLHAAIAAARGKMPNDPITVADMAILTELVARNANISDLTGLELATNLMRLHLNGEYTEAEERYTNSNSVSNLSPLAGLTHLTKLELHNNSISDLSPLVENTGLGNEDFVGVTGNPLNSPSINIHIPALQSRGVIVEFDDIVAQPADVNGDGIINVLDLVSAAFQFGERGQSLIADVNRDGVVDIFDLLLVAGMFDAAAAAPSVHPQASERLTAAAVRGWLTDTKALEISDPIMKRGVGVLQQLLASLTPTETKLLPNYPNPFNPETWIPYRLAKDAFVTLTIYDGAGQVVRTIDVGLQPASAYERRSHAIYWDGRNQTGEQVASGVYFYHLSAGDYSATRKMLILK